MIKKLLERIEDALWFKRNRKGQFKNCDQLARYYYGPCPKCKLSTINKMCPHCGWQGIRPYTGDDPFDK